MPLRNRAQPNLVLQTGRLAYGDDGTNSRVIRVDANGHVSVVGEMDFEFRPGRSALGSGAVAAGSRTASGTITTGGTANQTYWGTDQVYQPLYSGKIDGVAASGVVYGQLTIGIKSAAATCLGKLTARIQNGTTTVTGSPVTFLGLTGTISCTTAEIFQSYDINYLLTETDFNAIPFAVAIGVESSLAGTAAIARVMESSYIAGRIVPGT